jgi:methanol--5-hydroxybenzimidazolylcobamide Co-methyltransferase
VQNVKLLGGMAPICMLESLVYDCRLMNQAGAEGDDSVRRLRDWLITSDVGRDPQALVLSADVAIAIARRIVEAPSAYHAGIAAARQAVESIRQAHADGCLALPQREAGWPDMIEQQLDALPEDEPTFIDQQVALVDTQRCDLSQYDL